MVAKRQVFGVLLVAGVAVGAASPSRDPAQPALPFGIGSSVRYEIRESNADSVFVYQLRTTVTRIANGYLYLQETGGLVPTDLTFPITSHAVGTPQDSVIGEQLLVVDGQRFRCRVVRTDAVDVPLCGNDPVDYTRSTMYRWESPDFHQFGGVLRRVSGSSAIYYVDGHIDTRSDSVVWEVVRPHERWRIGNRSFDCCVVRTINPDADHTSQPDTVTRWLCPDLPSEEVRSIWIQHDPGGVETTERTAIAFDVRK